MILIDSLFVASVGVLLLFLYIRRRGSVHNKQPPPTVEPSQAKEKLTRLPDPDPLTEFDLSTASTRNHLYVNKTLRWPYFQTMSHQPMQINDWIEIDKDLKWYIEEKTRVIQEKGKHVIDSLPENDAACGELLEILVDYLHKRYPTLFELIDCEGGGIWNKVTDEKITGIQNKTGVDALTACSKLVQDDFLMGREREDGKVYFTGGLVAFPGFYLLSRKINKSLEQVHRPVPYFNEKILMSVERTLKRFSPSEPFERTSWEIVDDRNLHWHNIASNHNGKMSDQLDPSDMFFRVDHQTFRKLPRTKGIIFGVHPIMKRLADLEDSPLIPALLIKLHQEGDAKLMDYKLAPAYQERMIPYLQEMTKRQIEKGLITGAEEVTHFRELIAAGQPYPNTQTSLAHPTASERLMKGL